MDDMGDIEFPCTMPGCVTVFGSEEELKGHVAEDHLLCPVKAWGRNFLSAKDLGDHLERVHYQCQVPECGQSFSSRKGILDHISKTHVSDSSKLHKCQVEGCGKAYTAVQNLRYHMRTKHPLDGDSKPIKCPQCGDGFTAARQMKYHQGVAHGIWSCTSRDCTLEFETIEELTTHRVEFHGTTSQPLQYIRKFPTVSPSMNFAEEVTDTEDDADDESLGTDEETRVEKQFVCQVESCDFSHRSEWGIKKHCMARHPELKYPAASTATIPETDSTVILPIHFQQVYQRVQVALEQSRSNPAPTVECSNESRTITSAGGIHPFTKPATISSSTATSHSMSHNATNIQQRSTTTNRQGPSKPSTQFSNKSRVIKRGSSSNQQRQPISKAAGKNPKPNRAMSRPVAQAGPSRPPPIQKRSQSAAAPAKKKGLSQGAFAKMALFHSEEQEELRPIRRKLPTRAGKWSDDDDDSARYDTSSDSGSETEREHDFFASRRPSKKNKTAGSAGKEDPFYNDDLSDSGMSRGISPLRDTIPAAPPATIDLDTIVVDTGAVDPDEKEPPTTIIPASVFPPRGCVKDNKNLDFDSVIAFPIPPPLSERKKKSVGPRPEHRWLPECHPQAEMLFTSSIETPEMSWIVRRSRAMIKQGKNGSSMQVGAGGVKKRRRKGLPKAGSKRPKRAYNWRNPLKNKAWKIAGKGCPKMEIVVKERKGKGKE